MLSGFDLSNAGLNSASLIEVNLRGANLRGADLAFARLDYTDLTSVDLRDANLHRAHLPHVKLSGAKLSGATLSGATLWGVDLKGAKLPGSNLKGADLRDADLKGAKLPGSNLKSVDLRYANLSGADLRGADLRYSNLRDADLSGADLSGANIREVNLRGANLTGSKLSRSNLRFTSLRSAKLIGADLRAAKLSDSNFKGADLRDADLRYANLSHTVLLGVYLNDADLRGANLKRADLSNANLSGADLSSTSLDNANFKGADLKGAKFLGSNFEDAITEDVIMDERYENNIDEDGVSESMFRGAERAAQLDPEDPHARTRLNLAKARSGKPISAFPPPQDISNPPTRDRVLVSEILQWLDLASAGNTGGRHSQGLYNMHRGITMTAKKRVGKKTYDRAKMNKGWLNWVDAALSVYVKENFSASAISGPRTGYRMPSMKDVTNAGFPKPLRRYFAKVLTNQFEEAYDNGDIEESVDDSDNLFESGLRRAERGAKADPEDPLAKERLRAERGRAGQSTLTGSEILVLSAIRSYKSGKDYDGNEIRFAELNLAMGADIRDVEPKFSRAKYEKTKAELESKKLLNKRGSITPKGKAALEQAAKDLGTTWHNTRGLSRYANYNEDTDLPEPHEIPIKEMSNSALEDKYMDQFNKLVYDSWGGRPQNRLFDPSKLPSLPKDGREAMGLKTPTGVRLRIEMETDRGKDSIKCESNEDILRFNSLVDEISGRGSLVEDTRKGSYTSRTTKKSFPFATKKAKYAKATIQSLRYNLKDAREAMKAADSMGDEIASGYYADEIHTIAAELKKRQMKEGIDRLGNRS